MLDSVSMTDSAFERVRASLTKEELSIICSIVARCKSGCRERKSPAKALSSRRNAEIAAAVRKGDLVEAERLRWEYYPEKQRAREIAAKLGK